MDKRMCRFSEGMITLPEGYSERTLNTFADPSGREPPITLSRDSLGNCNSLEEYIASQLGLLQQQTKGWRQAPCEEAELGKGLATGVMLSYDFLRPDNLRLFQKQALFTLDMEHLLIFSLSSPCAPTQADTQRFNAILQSFRIDI